MPKSAITYHLRLKEGGEVRLRPHLSGHPCGMHTVFGAVGPGQRAVHDGLVLPDVEVSPGPLARVTGAAPPVAYGTLDCLALPVRDPHMELVLRFLALLKLSPVNIMDRGISDFLCGLHRLWIGTQGLSRGARRTPASPLRARDLLWTYAGGSGCSMTRLNSCALCLVVDASKRRLW